MHLITGSAGYVASELMPALRNSEFEIVGIDRTAHENEALQESIVGDLLDTETYNSIDSIDCVIHLAAAKGDWGISAEEYYRDNVEATARLLKEGRARRVKRWIFYSTVSALGPSRLPLDEDDEAKPVIPYGTSKLECEKLFQRYADEDPSAEIIIIRPSVVFGPRNPENTNIHRLIESIYRNRFVMVGKGQVYKTTSFLPNLVAATMFLLDRFRPGVQVFHYVDDPVWSTRQLVDHIYRTLGKRGPLLRLPLPVASSIAKLSDVAADVARIDLPITSARIEKFCTDTNFSSKKIRELGFKQPFNMTEAVDQTASWYLEEFVNRKQSVDDAKRNTA